MHQIEDKRLEECRKFLAFPGPSKTREELVDIVRDLIWAIEELQFRRLQERTVVKIEPDNRPYLLFGSDEAILAFVEEYKLMDDQWAGADLERLRNVLPRTVRARKLDDTCEGLWKKWEELCLTYDAPAEGNA